MSGADLPSLANDLIRGLMPHVPRGKPRHWDLDDVIALKIHAALIDAGFRRPSASDIAMQTRELLRRYPDREAYYLIRHETASGPVARVLHFEPTKEQPILLKLSIGRMRAALQAPFVRFAS